MFDTLDAIVYKTYCVIRERRSGWLDVAVVKSERHFDDDIPDEVIEYPVEDNRRMWRARKTKRILEDGDFDTIKVFIDGQFCYATRWLNA